MKALDLNSSIIEGYLRLLNNLSPDSKLDLISKLTLSVKKDIGSQKRSFYKAFGVWDPKDRVEIIVDEIRNTRTFNRQIEEL